MFEDYTYEERLAFCQAMANIIASDNKVLPEERAELDGLIKSAGLSMADAEVARTINDELAKPRPITDILKKIKRRPLAAALFRMLIEAACVDGEVAPEERERVLEAAKTFGMNPKAADELLNWTLQSILHERKEREILAKLDA
jgi:uncharacterized membrane protein YebE (DUF533 family)